MDDASPPVVALEPARNAWKRVVVGFLIGRRNIQSHFHRSSRWSAPHRTTHPRRKQNNLHVNATQIRQPLIRTHDAASCPGFCIDIGARKSVTDRKELGKIFMQQKIRVPNIQKSPGTHRFRFAEKLFDSLAKVSLFFSTPGGILPIRVDLEVVQVDIPALLGMDIWDREGLIAETVAGRLTKRVKTRCKLVQEQCVDEGSTLLHGSPSRHIYSRMPFAFGTFFARSQLLKCTSSSFIRPLRSYSTYFAKRDPK